MSVQSETSRISYSGNNSAVTAYAVPFKFFENSHLKVVVLDAAGTETILTNGGGFTASGAGEESGGQIVTTLPWSADNTITIERLMPYDQPFVLEEGQRFPMKLVEKILDWIVMQIQQLKTSGNRFLSFPFSEPANFRTDLPTPELRKGTWYGNHPVTGEFGLYSDADIAPRILAHYGLSISSEDVLAAISAIAPIRLEAAPNSSTPGRFGQLAIVPEQRSIQITGTLGYDGTPIAVPVLIPFAGYIEEFGNRAFYYEQVPGEGDYFVGFNTILNGWEIRFMGLSGGYWTSPETVNDPEDVATWTPEGITTGTPVLEVILGSPQVWINISPEGEVNNWLNLTP